ncbi:glycosyltransferase family 2 protein [Flavobacterium yafengii]|uniref:glycosyltransferase family 2 protein n=1 Tax=Flavobacterium yafengii TaxID=3041253 RepID=UPI0024A9BFA5|nr:glycosyltransferase [Flavobacterium yafengii]MDI5898170.1 glycosyltransferase [Flavobacterium yafengii]
MSPKPKITVLLPVYNCELYVQMAVESILNQSYADFELLIIDDASTDATVAILKRFDDARIQLIEKPVNSGYTNSLNYGLQLAKGEYIARMDGDDISNPSRFAQQIAFLDVHPEVVVCGTSYKIIGNDKRIELPETHDAIKIGLLWGNCISHPSVMIRKKVLDDYAIQYDTSREPAEDYDMWVRLLSLGKMHNLQEVLFEYRLYGNQVSRKRAEEQKKNDVLAKFEMLDYLDLQWDNQEYEFLERQFGKTEVVSFKELKIFKQIQKKLEIANISGFFESKKFNQYLIDLEADVLRKCFLKQKRYSPTIYLEYLLAKYKWKAKLSPKQELKLGLKSLVFWKTQRDKSKANPKTTLKNKNNR